jgi:hypothetical protein
MGHIGCYFQKQVSKAFSANTLAAITGQGFLRSPLKHAYKTRAIKSMQKLPGNVITFENTSQPRRAVTPATKVHHL